MTAFLYALAGVLLLVGVGLAVRSQRAPEPVPFSWNGDPVVLDGEYVRDERLGAS